MDPVAIRSYLASIGQQQGGGQGGASALLSGLRQRLYGPQALQALQGVQGRGGGAAAPAQPAEPPWMALARAGVQGTGSAAGNRAAAAALPNQPQIQSFPQPQGRPGRQAGGVGAAGVGAQMMPPPADYWTADRVAQATANTAGGDVGFQPGASGPITPQALDNLRQNTQGMSPQEIQLQMAGTPAPGPFSGQPLPVGRPTFQSGGGLMAPPEPSPGPTFSDELPPALATYPAANQGPAYGADGIMGQLPGPRPKPTAPPRAGAPAAPAPAGPAASPAALGAEQFQGPNARRIVQARQGIFNNVRQALRRPAPGGKVGR